MVKMIETMVKKEIVTDVIKPRNLNYSLNDYWYAISGDGPLAYEWKDKPHRLVYDLIGALIKAKTEKII